VPKGEAGRAQLVLQVRAEHPGLYPGRPRHAVDLEHLVQLVQGDGHDRPPILGRGDALDHR
jgi:hypothetical protein